MTPISPAPRTTRGNAWLAKTEQRRKAKAKRRAQNKAAHQARKLNW